MSSLGTVVLNNGNAGAGATNTDNASAAEKLTVTKEQLLWAKIGIGGVIFGSLLFFLSLLHIAFFENFPDFPVIAFTCAASGLIIAGISQSICQIKSGLPTTLHIVLL